MKFVGSGLEGMEEGVPVVNTVQGRIKRSTEWEPSLKIFDYLSLVSPLYKVVKRQNLIFNQPTVDIEAPKTTEEEEAGKRHDSVCYRRNRAQTSHIPV